MLFVNVKVSTKDSKDSLSFNSLLAVFEVISSCSLGKRYTFGFL